MTSSYAATPPSWPWRGDTTQRGDGHGHSAATEQRLNEAYLQRQQAQLVHALDGGDVTRMTRTTLHLLYQSRPEGTALHAKLPEVVLLLLLEDIVLTRNHAVVTWQTLHDAWNDILRPRESAVHLMIDADMLVLQTEDGAASYLDARAPRTLWTLATTRLARALRSSSSEGRRDDVVVTLEEPPRPTKRRRLFLAGNGGAPITAAQQTVRTVLVTWLAAVEARVAAGTTKTDPTALTARWSHLTAGYDTKLHESLVLAALNAALLRPVTTTTTTDVQTCLARCE